MKHFYALLVVFLLFGCASSDDLIQTQKTVAYLTLELQNQKEELNRRISQVEKMVKEQEERTLREKKERERESQQLISLMVTMDGLNDRMKGLLGKVDELEHQLNTYWREIKDELSNIKKTAVPQITEQKKEDKTFKDLYREAFELYQKGNYEESVKKFSDFVRSYPDAPLIPNAYYWLGEGFMSLKNYEKAILCFQEIIEKYRTSEFTPKAYLSQAEAFAFLGDKKNASTILKRVIELFPKSEEAKIAERRLKTLLSE